MFHTCSHKKIGLCDSCFCVFFSTAWVQKIKAASEEFIETEKKKREKAYQGLSPRSTTLTPAMCWWWHLRLTCVCVCVCLQHGLWRPVGSVDSLLLSWRPLNSRHQNPTVSINTCYRMSCHLTVLITRLPAHMCSFPPAGKSNPYCEVNMGSQIFMSRTLNDTLNPKWNFNCQFHIKDLYQDVLCITISEKNQFSPDGQLPATFLTLSLIHTNYNWYLSKSAKLWN